MRPLVRSLRTVILALAMIAARGGAGATMPEPAHEAGATLASVQGSVDVRSGGASQLKTLDSWRLLAANTLRPADSGNTQEIPAVARNDGRAPGSWALLLAGLAGALAIGRRRLSSIADRSIARHRRQQG